LFYWDFGSDIEELRIPAIQITLIILCSSCWLLLHEFCFHPPSMSFSCSFSTVGGLELLTMNEMCQARSNYFIDVTSAFNPLLHKLLLLETVGHS